MSRHRQTSSSSLPPTESSTPWPTYKTGPHDHLHALGVMSVNYNLFEFALSRLLKHYAGSSVSDFFFDKLNNEERLSAIRHFAAKGEQDRKILSLIEGLIKYFSACTNNRNILMHSRYSDDTHPDEILSLEKIAIEGADWADIFYIAFT